MGGARTCNLSSEKMAQAVALVNASTVKDISEESSATAGVLYKKLLNDT